MKTVKPGIRLKPSGKYVATKSIDGKRHYKEFNSLREAEIWKNKFHPLASPQPSMKFNIPAASDQSNGKDKSIKFREVYERYVNGKMKSLSPYTQYKKKKRLDRFLPPLFGLRMCEITPEVITALLEKAKLGASDKFERANFSEELKGLKSIFNWYKECDFTFQSPVMGYHFDVGKIRDIERKKKDMNKEQVIAFINHLSEPFQSMAIIQFCLALRVGEVAALNTSTVSFKERTVTISETIVWLKTVPLPKRSTKTKDVTTLSMNDEMVNRLRTLDIQRPKGCKHFFHRDGKIMRYEWILEAYNNALKEAGLHDFSGTHFLRHTMGTIARRSSGLDAAQAILRHTTSRMSEHYARLDVNEKASKVVIEAGDLFLKSRATNATSEKEKLESLSS
jgi:integrase